MDVLVSILSEFGFIRVSSSLRTPVVIHCVPGAGKTSCVRELIKRDSRFEAFTAGIEDQPNLEGRWIRKFSGELTAGKYSIIDEYTLLKELPEGAFAVFGDPLQSNSTVPLSADFLLKVSRRFGRSTAALLRDLGFEVESCKDDVVEISDIFRADPEGQVIHFEPEIACLLRRHCVESKSLSEIVGQTFEVVTFVTSENSPLIDRVAAFQCLTRHKLKLIILCPNATYAAA